MVELTFVIVCRVQIRIIEHYLKVYERINFTVCHSAPVRVIDTRFFFIKYVYWSNVLTERFYILYKYQTKEDTSF